MLNFKKNKRTSKRSAFTLIELSIVLIIIGLLVAGVTGGASLIKSAQLRALMSEVIGYKVAVNSFSAIYDDLPGDYGVAIGGALAGNGDKAIEYAVGDGSADSTILEGPNAWHHLIDSGTVDDTLTINTGGIALADADTDNDHSVGTNMPDSKLDGVGFMFDNDGTSNLLVATGNIADITPTGSATAINFTRTGVMTPVDALSIDAKLDDGIANAGEVQAGIAGSCSSTTTYTTTDADEECALEFTVDIS